MYAIMGITGQVGGAAARYLLDQQQAVRAVVRDAAKGRLWAERGAAVVIADWLNTETLTRAFADAEAVFVMLPANFAPLPDFTETVALLQAITHALRRASPARVVTLSSIGAHRSHDLGLITQLRMLEDAIDALPMPRAHVHAAWFMENLQRDVARARNEGRLESCLSPLDHAIPMVATDDIGRVIAQTLSQSWQGRRVIELEGPKRYSPRDMGHALAAVLEHDVDTVAVPREQWAARFVGEGMPADRIGPRIAMLDGFNSGWIDFEGGAAEHVRGRIPLGYVADELVSACPAVLESAA